MTTICRHLFCACAVSLCLATAVSASISFRFTGTEQNIENVPIAPVDGTGLTVTTTGHLIQANDPDSAALSYITPLGLGVNDTTAVPTDRNQVPVSLFTAINTFQVESNGVGEFIRLQFSAPANWTSSISRTRGPASDSAWWRTARWLTSGAYSARTRSSRFIRLAWCSFPSGCRLPPRTIFTRTPPGISTTCT